MPRAVKAWDGDARSSVDFARRLGNAILLQAIEDIIHPPPYEREKAQLIRAGWIHWIFHGNRDFYDICELAGWHPDDFRRHARAVIDGKKGKWRADAGSGANYSRRKMQRESKKRQEIFHSSPDRRYEHLA